VHRLPLSLLFVVLLGVFVVGVALDALFDRYHPVSTTPLAEIRSIGQGLADVLDANESLEEIVDAWPENSPYDFKLENTADLVLPPLLTNELISKGVLTLGSDQGVSFHFYLTQHAKVLSIQSTLMEDGAKPKISWVLTILFYLATLILVVLWLRPLLQRHRLLRQSTKAFGEGDLSSRVETRGLTYIQDIEYSFNNMADRIQQLVEDNKMLTSAVSHDLRTPLARLRFGFDTLSQTSKETSKAVYLKRINNDLKEMESLVESLLRYARLDNVLEGVDKQVIAIQHLLEECVAQYYENEIDIRLESHSSSEADSLVVWGGIDHIAMLLNNLLSNALTHARSRLVIYLSVENSCVVIKFCDDGPGIPPESREQVMKPFERGKAVVNGDSGFGMGLAIAARIAQHHGGGIVIGECEQLGGALVTVTLTRWCESAEQNS